MSAAEQLFCARASLVVGRFEPSDRDLALIGTICREVDGLPLAIELAAARLATLSLSDLASNVSGRLDLLRRRRDRGDRHDSMRAAIAWSFELMAPTEQALLEALRHLPR